MKKFVLLCLSFVLIFGCTACKKKDNLDKLSKELSTYSINLDIDTTTHAVQAYEELNYKNNTNTVLKTIKFHLYPQFFKEGATQNVVSNIHLNEAYPHGMSYSEFDVSRVVINGENSAVVYSGEHNGILNVELTNSLLPNENIKLEFYFSFTLPNCCHRFGYGDNTMNLGNFYIIACVFENGAFNESGYHANGDPFYSDMANYNVNVKYPSNYTIASSGQRTSFKTESNINSATYQAKMVRDFALVLSDKFEVKTGKVNNTTIEYYYFNDPNADKSLQAGIDAITTFNKLFGEYPYKTFSIVKTDFVYGGMEYPNLVMISADIDNLDDYMNVIIHETAHQWWYGLVGNNEYKYPWLDEALTEYSTLLFYDNNNGYNLKHSEMLNATKSNYTLFITVYQDVLGTIDTSMRAVDEYSTEPEYTYCTYVKGVLMYESLYQLIGEKKFLSGLKNYFENYKFKNAEPINLIFSFEEEAKTELKNFFDSWIKGKVVIR